MTTHEKDCLRYHAFNAWYAERNNIPFPYHWNYFMLNWTDITELDQFAEIFHIKPNQKGWSAARVLFYKLQKIHYETNKQTL